MPKTKSIPRGKTRRPDPEGASWQAEAGARWRAAGGDMDRYAPPALPAWSAPAHVKRELLGRYLFDRDTGVVHDVQHALVACGIDGIANGTFIHFAAELAGAVPADVVDCTCMGA